MDFTKNYVTTTESLPVDNLFDYIDVQGIPKIGGTVDYGTHQEVQSWYDTGVHPTDPDLSLVEKLPYSHLSNGQNVYVWREGTSDSEPKWIPAVFAFVDEGKPRAYENGKNEFTSMGFVKAYSDAISISEYNERF